MGFTKLKDSPDSQYTQTTWMTASNLPLPTATKYTKSTGHE